MKIELDPDMCDKIVAATLVATYKLLKNDIKKAKKNPNHYAPEDLEMYESVIEGLKLVGPWYVFDWEGKIKSK